MSAISYARRNRKPSAIVGWFAEHTLLAFNLVLFAAQLLFVILTSFMTDDEALTAALWPNPWTFAPFPIPT